MLARSPIVEKCQGCSHVGHVSHPERYCEVYPNPAYWWTNKECPAATHKEISKDTAKQKKKRVGQPKSKKGKYSKQ